VAVAQDRIREKAFFRACNLGVAPYAVIECDTDVAQAPAALFPGILKRARFGYDGKGQARVANAEEARKAFHDMGAESCVLEQRIALKCEISVVVARGADGIGRTFPVSENRHRNGILDVSIVPARVTPELAKRAEEWALRVADKLEYCGVLAVEFFVTQDGELLVNEMAPRPHNSGHYTIDACVTSQFEQQVRTLCGLPLGDARLLSPVVMVNLLGEAWQDGAPQWDRVLNLPDAKLHLYGKHEARGGRKMGHYTVLDRSAEAALQKALITRAALYPDWTD
jgi:5-(carboxyamino)imidazole ribonucleotide synthase